MTKKPKRIRRTAVEARRVILDAAEKRLAENGPEGIRLQDIANDVGISHPTILHHFDNREGLVLALSRRGVEQLRGSLLAAFAEPRAGAADIHAILERVFEVLGAHGHSRLVAWMVLGGIWQHDVHSTEILRELIDLIHKMRVDESASREIAPPSRENTQFIIMLGAITAFGDGVFGPLVRQASGLPDEQDSARKFRDQFADMLQGLLQSPG